MQDAANAANDGAGNDRIVGGNGVDDMHGEAGNDWMSSNDGVVDGIIDGGNDGGDTLQRDGNPNMTDNYTGCAIVSNF